MVLKQGGVPHAKSTRSTPRSFKRRNVASL
jgi:hypothetical protein